MSHAMTRRTFLKISGSTVIGGLAAYAGLSVLARGGAAREPRAGEERVVPTFCELCFWKCGVLAHVRDGRVVKLVGNPAHPLSNGRLCPRGVAGMSALYDPDRLRQPLLRVREGGQERWKEVSWEEALAHTGRRLLEIKEKHGAGSIALFSHGHGGGFFKTLLAGLGSHTVVAPSYDQCRGPRQEGFVLTYGEDVGSPEALDIPHSRCVAFLGSHLGENMHNTAVQDLSAASDGGAVLITVDPRCSILASKSQYWLPIKPGTDTALLLAWAHVLIEEGLYRKEFVAQSTHGFEELREHVKSLTPEWAYLETGIEPAEIRATARELGRHAPAALVHPGRHVTWYGNDTQRSRAIAIVNALLGNWGKKGGIYLPSRFPLAKLPLPPEPPAAEIPLRQSFPLASSPCAYDVCESSLSEPGSPATIKAWLVYGCNVPLTLPDTARVIRAMDEVELVVAIDTMPAEVTAYADVVLPENTYLERYDELHAPPYRVPYVALRQPVVDSLNDSKPGWWIAKNLAETMGLGAFFPWADAEEYLKGLCARSQVSFEELQRHGVVVGRGESIYDASEAMEFPTPTGKVELLSTRLAEAGTPALPPYERPEQPPPGFFRLLFGRAPVHTFSRTTNTPMLLEIFPENELWVNAEMARILGLRRGDRVMLENGDGVKTGPIRVRATERIRQDCVYMVHGFGRENRKLRASFGKGANDSRLITRVKRDPIMGGTGMNVNFVTLTKEA